MKNWKHFEIALRIAEIRADQKSIRLAFNVAQAVLEKGDSLTIKEIVILQVENDEFFRNLYESTKGLVEKTDQ